jgi:transcriptional antiterminator RfaH
MDAAVAEWYVIHTHPRQEDRAIRNLLLWGIELLELWVRAPRNVGGLEPLFPGYVFARFDITSMLRNIRFTRGVHSVLLRALTWQARVELDVNQIARLAT